MQYFSDRVCSNTLPIEVDALFSLTAFVGYIEYRTGRLGT